MTLEDLGTKVSNGSIGDTTQGEQTGNKILHDSYNII